MVALALGPEWKLTWEHGWDWAPWDVEHESGARIEVKQSAARQTWDREEVAKRRNPSFSIALRKGYSTRDGSRWVEFQTPSRPADIYVFAWHNERRRRHADHRDSTQWRFFVVPEPQLPICQVNIGLTGIERITSHCSMQELNGAVAGVFPGSEALKAQTISER